MKDVFGRAISDLQRVLAEAGEAERLRIERIIARLETGSAVHLSGETSVRATLDGFDRTGTPLRLERMPSPPCADPARRSPG